jgi:hypothetical protein
MRFSLVHVDAEDGAIECVVVVEETDVKITLSVAPRMTGAEVNRQSFAFINHPVFSFHV